MERRGFCLKSSVDGGGGGGGESLNRVLERKSPVVSSSVVPYTQPFGLKQPLGGT